MPEKYRRPHTHERRQTIADMQEQWRAERQALATVRRFNASLSAIHAQAKPPVYSVTEIDVTNVDAYTKEYAPLAQASIKKSGGKLLAAGQKVTSLEGAPPKPRVAIQVWDSLEQVQLGAIQPITKQLE